MNLRTVVPFLALGIALAAIAWLLTRPLPPPTDDEVEVAREGEAAKDGNRRPGVPFRPGGTAPAGEGTDGTGNTPPGGATSVIGLREPSGVDYSEPAEVRAALGRALEGEPRDWRAVRRLLELYHEPLDPDLRRALLDALRGPDRVSAKEALAFAQDGELVGDLLAMLDDPEAPGDLRSAVLDVLARMPGAAVDEVVLGLESRLEGEPMRDAILLRAIARRGGEEAARAIVQYLERAPDPLRVPGRLALGQELRKDPDAMRAVAAALANADRPDTVVALAGLAAVPGATELVPALVALDRDDRSEELRRAALGALAQIGSAGAVEHLIAASRRDDALGGAALDEVGRIASADAKAREMLMAALEDAANQPRPVEARRQLLTALSNLGHAAAAPAFRDALADPDDRVRHAAAFGLGRMGARGQPYVEDLMRAYATSDDRVRRSIVQALGMVGGDEARSRLEQMSSDTGLSPGVRRAVTAALQRLGPEKEAADAGPAQLQGGGR